MSIPRSIRFWNQLATPGDPLVSMVVTAHKYVDTLGCLLFSLKCQTYKNWEAIVVHDGPAPPEIHTLLRDRVQDSRIRMIETPEVRGTWGHYSRQPGIEACEGDVIGITNEDNYYVPVYLEAMLHTLLTDEAHMVYCDYVHNYFNYSYFTPNRLREVGFDVGCWLARANLVKATPWIYYEFDGDATYAKALLAKAPHVARVRTPVNGNCQCCPTRWGQDACYFVHN